MEKFYYTHGMSADGRRFLFAAYGEWLSEYHYYAAGEKESARIRAKAEILKKLGDAVTTAQYEYNQARGAPDAL